MKTYTLTGPEARIYDESDDEHISDLMSQLRRRFGPLAAGEPVETEVRHPEGFVVSAHTRGSGLLIEEGDA